MVWWMYCIEKSGSKDNGSEEYEKSEFQFKFWKKDKEFVMIKYFDYVMENVLEFRCQFCEFLFYSNNDCYWECYNFKYFFNFDIFVMEFEFKVKVKVDLDFFM